VYCARHKKAAKQITSVYAVKLAIPNVVGAITGFIATSLMKANPDLASYLLGVMMSVANLFLTPIYLSSLSCSN
jgi:hypothetical protein